MINHWVGNIPLIPIKPTGVTGLTTISLAPTHSHWQRMLSALFFVYTPLFLTLGFAGAAIHYLIYSLENGQLFLHELN